MNKLESDNLFLNFQTVHFRLHFISSKQNKILQMKASLVFKEKNDLVSSFDETYTFTIYQNLYVDHYLLENKSVHLFLE